ncbi:histidine phosphatase family protein [Paenibacillus pasadenensis]|uniref:histidine phosphatase family protein n=1 Tax=Paenibacillus pasadenensis TaxID=217090 RepID=UPI002041C54E|nr:histidine phosphatase family protein [Paenibacillus pasadenensis]MCM3747485.1 histidine phosphatase family protein [Paenibacillus pasadenensis]
MRLGLIRHGKTDWNGLGRIQGVTDIPLNEEGYRQAELLAVRLLNDGEYWDAVVTSDLSRSIETGKVIADKLGIPLLEPEPLLTERSFGLIEGTLEQERLERWGENWRTHPEAGVETDESVRSRAASFLQTYTERMPEGRLLAVTHGSYLAQMLGVMVEGLDQPYLHNMCYSILEYSPEGWKSLLHNCTLHLQAKV